MAYNKSQGLSFLSRTELEWLLRNKQLSKSFEYKIKSTIKKKINKFLNFELPLLIQNEIVDKQLIQDILDNPNDMLLGLGKEKVAGPNPAQGCDFEHEFQSRFSFGLIFCYPIEQDEDIRSAE